MNATPTAAPTATAMRVVCAWCGRLMRDGPEPVSHGICPTCAKAELDEHRATEARHGHEILGPEATLITIGNGDGKRRCDAKCYDATGAHCDCVCGGANHGNGLRAAQGWTEEQGRKLLAAVGARFPERQGELFAEVKRG